MKNIFYLMVLLVAGSLGGYWAMNAYLSPSEETVTVEGTVLLEKVERVAKLITIEGYFSELYDHEDYYSYDISIFRKKAILKVRGRVSIGYDFEQMEFAVNPAKRELEIRYLPPPEILSIDSDVSYYDIQEGLFNSFDEEDLTKLNVAAKELIREKAQNSDLMGKAEKQALDVQELINIIAKEAGWTVVKWTPMEYETFQSNAENTDSLRH